MMKNIYFKLFDKTKTEIYFDLLTIISSIRRTTLGWEAFGLSNYISVIEPSRYYIARGIKHAK
jgi:hypothetical protein